MDKPATMPRSHADAELAELLACTRHAVRAVLQLEQAQLLGVQQAGIGNVFAGQAMARTI